MSKNRATETEIVDIAVRLAQELQEFVNEAERAGCEDPLPSTVALLNDWGDIYQRTSLNWQRFYAEKAGDENTLLSEL